MSGCASAYHLMWQHAKPMVLLSTNPQPSHTSTNPTHAIPYKAQEIKMMIQDIPMQHWVSNRVSWLGDILVIILHFINQPILGMVGGIVLATWVFR